MCHIEKTKILNDKKSSFEETGDFKPYGLVIFLVYFANVDIDHTRVVLLVQILSYCINFHKGGNNFRFRGFRDFCAELIVDLLD